MINRPGVAGLFYKQLFSMAFCLKGKAMVMAPPVSLGGISILGGWVRTDKNIHVCKACNWSRVVDCLITVSCLALDYLMTVL